MARRRESTRARGDRGEALACRALERAGVRILARNVHLRHAELDVIGLDGDVLCFVEVRLRTGRRLGSAEESVTTRKQRRLVRAAREWLARERAQGGPRYRSVRFDVVAIDAGESPPRVRHLRDAFHA